MRADQGLVSRGLARSRAVARELIDTGHVRLDGTVVTKAAQQVDPAALTVDGELDPWVGRAAYKLLAALQSFPVAVEGKRCIDVGASTGGFTQVLLHHGASQVVALDVGHGQLVEELREDPRVVDLPGTNIRDVTADAIGGRAALVVADLSFISLTLVLPQLASLVSDSGDLVTLVKPQFEVGRDRLARTGVVTSVSERRRALVAVLDAVAGAQLHVHGLAASPISGGTGNHEYLLWARPVAEGKMNDVQISTTITQVLAQEPA